MKDSDISKRADFSRIRYAQCWEDADVLLGGLDIKSGDACLSIASAGDNTLSLLAKAPSRVVAVDLSPAQLACLELRVAAFRELSHQELLELIGSCESRRRAELYQRCRSQLESEARTFWDANSGIIDAGIGSGGKFENYFRIFRERILPLVHSRKKVEMLLMPKGKEAREDFYAEKWDTWRWRLLFRMFFSRRVMGRHGRDREFFRYVSESDVAGKILERTGYALTELDPAENPYLSWILTGTHRGVLPFALREENFEAIRENLDCLELHCGPVEEVLESGTAFDRFNLSDIFEYLNPDHCETLYEKICESASPGARLAYWNMMVPRSRPDRMAERLRPLEELSESLHQEDKAFFYSRFIVEEVI